MSSTATSLIPSPVTSAFKTASAASAESRISKDVLGAKQYVVETAQHLRSTPSRPDPTNATNSTAARPSPGKFRHPRTAEIVARQSASTLTPVRARNAFVSSAVLVLSFPLVHIMTWCITETLGLVGSSTPSWSPWAFVYLLRGLLFANLIFQLRPSLPYISKQDDLSDIPLTPSQRALLGLNPSVSSSPASVISATEYITPPKYRRLSGSIPGPQSSGATSDRRSISANYSGSPLSISRHNAGFSPTPQSLRQTSGSPFSPSPNASPLFHKAINQSAQQLPDIDFSASTQSFGLSTGTGLSRSQSLRERSRRDSLEPTSPTPGTRSPQMVPGVNYKWLYEKGRRLPKSESFGSFGI